MRVAVRPAVRFRTLERFGFKCHYCGISAKDAVLEVDHLVAVANGGTNAESNLVAACETCNAGKSDMELSECLPLPPVRGYAVPVVPVIDLSSIRSHKVWEAEEQIAENVLSFVLGR